MQKHDATNLHYDFRLELDGTLKSWAVPKGPSLDPGVRRLAMMVEDHPLDYRNFEGTIPEGNYGAGKVIVWDEGYYHSFEDDDPDEGIKKLRAGLKKGDLKFVLEGEKLNGAFALVRTKFGGKGNSWLLIKKKDDFATKKDILKKEESVKTGRKIEDIADSAEAAEEVKEEKKAKPARVSKSKIIKEIISAGGKEGKIPRKVKPELAVLTDAPFSEEGWLFEIKFDGYRCIAELEDGSANLYSRNFISFDRKFEPVAKELQKLKFTAVLDGEIVILDEKGKSDFQLIQNYMKTKKGMLAYYVFDILHYEGYDLTKIPLIKRKEILRKILPEDSGIIRYSDHVLTDGETFFKAAEAQQLEGIIAKSAQSVYTIGRRTEDWLKIKTQMQQEAVIGGFTKPQGSRKHFGALILGLYEKEELRYIGHTGGGFNEESLGVMMEKLKPLVIEKSPFNTKFKANAPATWVKPELVCEVKFSEWTDEGYMRQPIFMGLREDKKAKEVKREKPKSLESMDMETAAEEKKTKTKKSGNKKTMPKPSGEFTPTHLEKIFWKKENITKGELIDYYTQIAPYIMPYIEDRPHSLNRHPNGISGGSFFQKDMGDTAPDWIKTAAIYSESNDKDINYLVATDVDSLLYMVNLGCIEINPWFSRIQALDKPDYSVIDLDPEGVSFGKVIETALVVKEVMDEAGAKCYCKTSGSTGLHIYIPLGAKYDYEISKNFAHL
ncbi:MAG TPA: DNA ligase D, partial [Ignavibacteriales bacterium]|nr:DNA ligase D [Ignavibacteriales bacterium]